REVALKIPRPDAVLTSELRARFQHEGRAAAGLDHPHIVPVHEAGEIGTFSYIASAYCPGITLAAWLAARTEPVPVREAASLVATLADAIHHAHTRGVLHRDLKPANVLLTFDRRQHTTGSAQETDLEPLSTDYRLLSTTPKITDFGLA